MKVPDHLFDNAQTVLDVGGWFIPEPRATHVVDLMPWETRGVKLTLSPLPGERFSKATWHQADFLRPDLRLPFADKSIDFVICGHTIEDLVEPRYLLDEMQRVAKRGYIECPSRWSEQTLGMRDRESPLPGHAHHHWLVESSGDELLLYSKTDSHLEGTPRLLPLLFSNAAVASGQGDFAVGHVWQDTIKYRKITGAECRRRAEEFVAGLRPGAGLRAKDAAIRFLRRARSKLRGRPAEDPQWWSRVVEESRPYSALELK